MDNIKNIINEVWEYAEMNREKNKTIEKVYNWLNRDNLYSVILDRNTFWFEKTNSSTVIPNYIYHWLIKFYEEKGYKYLFNNNKNI